MKPLNKFSIMMATVLSTMVSGGVFAANEDPLFCACVPVDDDGTSIAVLEQACADYSINNRYSRWRLRAPQKGEKFRDIIVNPPPCNGSINGFVVCQGGTLDGLAEPLVCAGAPAERILIVQ